MINNIVVIGAGTMGNGIAHVFAQQEKKVILNDISQDALDKAINTIAKNMDRQVSKGDFSAKEKEKYLAGIVLSTQLEDSLKAADLVIEAATENSNLKLDIFKTIDQHAPGHAILASNTSSISITKIAAATKRPDKVIGMHFMNPVPVMKLVEVINGYNTSPATTDTILNESKNLGKVPVVVNDYPGFIANRLLMPLINEAIYALHEGVAGVGEIDTVMKLGMAHPMGPLQLADFIGLDICLAIMKVLYEGFNNPKYAPCPLLTNMVQAGHLGRKSGTGFYQWIKGSKDLKVAEQFKANR